MGLQSATTWLFVTVCKFTSFTLNSAAEAEHSAQRPVSSPHGRRYSSVTGWKPEESRDLHTHTGILLNEKLDDFPLVPLVSVHI